MGVVPSLPGDLKAGEIPWTRDPSAPLRSAQDDSLISAVHLPLATRYLPLVTSSHASLFHRAPEMG